ncbi:MAG TPA: hypothetical protein VLW85_00865 [Myxococcales bacterium]|nr:hypothetical protein [Myxococcales bacterium]
MTTDDVKAKVLEFTLRPLSGVVAVEEPGGARLLEPGTGKELRVKWDEIAEVHERSSAQRAAPYMLLVFHGGRQVALADVGFAFAPSTANTGPLPQLPQTLCFRDFAHLSRGIEQLLAEEGREKEVLGAILLCIALLDGARGVGLAVDREERRLDKLLKELEQRGMKL